jgi:hypothetical protein
MTACGTEQPAWFVPGADIYDCYVEVKIGALCLRKMLNKRFMPRKVIFRLSRLWWKGKTLNASQENH